MCVCVCTYYVCVCVTFETCVFHSLSFVVVIVTMIK
jgi:hypothetical protein